MDFGGEMGNINHGWSGNGTPMFIVRNNNDGHSFLNFFLFIFAFLTFCFAEWQCKPRQSFIQDALDRVYQRG
jgi:hypothetical protein